MVTVLTGGAQGRKAAAETLENTEARRWEMNSDVEIENEMRWERVRGPERRSAAV